MGGRSPPSFCFSFSTTVARLARREHPLDIELSAAGLDRLYMTVYRGFR